MLRGLFFLLFSSICLAQGEANIWYFGEYAGLDFNSGTPVALTDGQLKTDEGCATICDSSGQLLFYTNGIYVWNRMHQIMPNGMGLLGNSSSSQAALIVPKPGSTTIYYIFTSVELANVSGVRYSEVDLSLNGGLGDVTVNKNVLLLTPACEKITAIKKGNNTDYWVVIHGFGNNSFLAYSVTASGINTTPVVSNVGVNIVDNVNKTIGYLKFSPDGTQLLSCNYQDIVQLFDFDFDTGIISNPRTVSTKTANYGAEFSPSGDIAYITTGDVYIFELIQYDLTVADIPSSATQLYEATVLAHQIGALQLAPDGKIYSPIFDEHFISRVNNPNILGVGCDFQLNAVDLGTGIGKGGLPQYIQSFFNASFAVQNLCLGSATEFVLNSTATVTSAVWDFGDGSPTVNMINPSHTYATDGDYTVSVVVISVNGTATISKSITISSIPLVATPISNKTVCGSANMNYDLSQFNSVLLGSQSTLDYGVAYFTSMSNAINHIGLLSNLQSLTLGTTTFYAKIYNLKNNRCYAITSFDVKLYDKPVANQPIDYIICENLPFDSVEQFNLSTKNSEILGTQNPADFTISFHQTQLNSDNDNFQLPLLYSNTLPEEILFVRVENNLNSSCYTTTTFNLSVIQQPQLLTVSDFKICDDVSNDGIALFDLSQKTNEILNGQSSTVFQVYYYLSLDDAQNDVNRIVAPLNNTSANQVVYYRIEAIGNSNCSAISNFKLVVSRKPEVNVPSNYFQCDDVVNDGVTFFNLNSVSSSVFGNQNASQYSISYHLTQSDADSGNNALATTYQNTSNPQTLFVRIENNQNTTCFATTSFQIGLYQMPIANQPSNLFVCDDESNDGKAVFDLSQQDDSILGVQDEADFVITYYSDINDAQSGLNALATNFTSVSNQQIIYGRIENKLSSTCFAVTSFTIFVKPKPNLLLSDSYTICEGKTITVAAPSGFSSYSWSNGDTTSTTTFTAATTYSLTVTQNYGDITCSTIKDVVVYNSNIATITKIITTDWTDNQNSIAIEVSGDGDYEYSLNEGSFQSSATFSGLRNGDYIVCVNDKKGCGFICEDVFLLNYQKFFTPNGDGYNDVWKIKNSFVEPNMQLKLFDRYGKLLTVFDGLDKGWDGTFNGTLLPADDYWFIVKRQNGKEFKGHFALKR